MSRHLKLIAAVAVVLVALSGFSPARKGGGRSGSSSSKGGGCSSSSSSSHNNSSSYDSDSDSDYGKGYGDGYRRGSRHNTTTGTTGSRHSRGSTDGTVEECAAATGDGAKAVVNVSNTTGRTKTLRVKVEFRDTSDTVVDAGSASVTVSGNGSSSVDVPMENPQRLDEVSECEVVSVS